MDEIREFIQAVVTFGTSVMATTGWSLTTVFLAFAATGTVGVFILATTLKLIHGMLYGNYITDVLTTSIELRRTIANAQSTGHNLVTTIRLKKGANHALRLHSLDVTIFTHTNADLNSAIGNWPKERRSSDGYWIPDEHNRSINGAGTNPVVRNILSIWTSEHGRSLNLVPGEETQYASYCEIQANEICEVVVTLKGERYKSWIARGIGYVWYWFRSVTCAIPFIIRCSLRCFSGAERPEWIRPFQTVFWTASGVTTPADVILLPTAPEKAPRRDTAITAETMDIASLAAPAVAGNNPLSP